MKRYGLIAAFLAAAALGACTNSGAGRRSDAGTGNADYGTQRRMDVYGGATAPVLPTMGAPGYGE